MRSLTKHALVGAVALLALAGCGEKKTELGQGEIGRASCRERVLRLV